MHLWCQQHCVSITHSLQHACRLELMRPDRSRGSCLQHKCNTRHQGREGQRRHTLMVQSVDPEKRRRSSYMARHTTAPRCPVSRCSSVVARAPLPSSAPAPAPAPAPPAPVQLDSSSSTRLPACAASLHTGLCTRLLTQARGVGACSLNPSLKYANLNLSKETQPPCATGCVEPYLAFQ